MTGSDKASNKKPFALKGGRRVQFRDGAQISLNAKNHLNYFWHKILYKQGSSKI